MNVDRRWLGTSVVRVRSLAAVLALLVAGCMVLGWGSRSRQMTAGASTDLSSIPASTSNRASLGSLTPALDPAAETLKLQSRAHALFAGMPLMFEPNQGQANLDASDLRVRYIARGSGYSLLLGSEGAILTLRSKQNSAKQKSASDPTLAATRVEALRMKLAGANPNALLTASDQLRATSNYILGNDPAKWRSNIPEFARVHYDNVYPGINLAFYGNQGQLEYDFQVAPGADPAQAVLEFDGAKRLKLQEGALVVEAEGGAVRLEAPQCLPANRRTPAAG